MRSNVFFEFGSSKAQLYASGKRAVHVGISVNTSGDLGSWKLENHQGRACLLGCWRVTFLSEEVNTSASIFHCSRISEWHWICYPMCFPTVCPIIYKLRLQAPHVILYFGKSSW